MLSGFLGSAINLGILCLSQVARHHPITPNSWRWLFHWCAFPAVLGLTILFFLPESPIWLRISRIKNSVQEKPLKVSILHKRNRITLFKAIIIGSIPLVGAWAASKWMIPWADQVAGPENPGYKAATQGWWALGATLGGFAGALLSSRIGPKRSYAIIGLSATIATCGLFLFTMPLEPIFLPLIFIQGLIATMFFGWLPLYLPAMFPTEVRAACTGIAYNTGRFLTALGVLASSILVRLFDGNYASIGAAAGCIYAMAILMAFYIPTSDKPLKCQVP
jgi:MFS family permease